MACSELQTAANQRNAKKSTGPKSKEGKEASRKNAVKHGMAGTGVAVPDEVQDEIDRRVRDWTEEMKPRTQLESWLVARVASGTARIDAAVKFEGQRRRSRLQGDPTRNPALLHADRLGDALERSKTGAEIVPELMQTVEGCDWLLGRWKCLRSLIETYGEYWSRGNLYEAARLSGHSYKDTLTSVDLSNLVRDYCLARPHHDRDKLTMKQFELIRLAQKTPLSPLSGDDNEVFGGDAKDLARKRIVKWVDARIECVERRRDLLLAHNETLPSADAGQPLIDLTLEGDRLRRYEVDIERQVHKALRRLDLIRKSRTQEEAESPPTDQNLPTRNEPIFAPAPTPPTPSVPAPVVLPCTQSAPAGCSKDHNSCRARTAREGNGDSNDRNVPRVPPGTARDVGGARRSDPANTIAKRTG